MTDIRRGEHISGPSAEQKIDHCLSKIQENGFADGVEWNDEISDSVTVEEIVGALVHAENVINGEQAE